MSLFTEISESMAEEESASKESISNISDFNGLRDVYLNALCNRALELQNDNNFDLNAADVRFSTSLNLSKVRNSLVAIIGAGGLGNWQWRILASMGFKRIAIYDDDNVGIENVGPQAHSIFDLNMPKVQAVENAALAYRGIKILARNKRVMSYSEICDDLGEDPDIVIGCTDSADFRNNFINSLTHDICTYGRDNQLPDLFIDYRMSLGDWVAYIVPTKAMKIYERRGQFCFWYKSAAVFPESEAVQEPCTERAIAYTGANAASFTGALLHWFYSGGRRKFYDTEYMRSFAEGDTVMPGRKISFSSRDFEFITDTVKEKKLEKKLAALRDKADMAWDFLRKGFGIPACFRYYESGDAIPDDYLDRYHGKLIVALKDKEVLLCGFDRVFFLGTDSYGIINLHVLGTYDLSLMQPYVIYEIESNELLQRYGLFKLLSAKPGDVFRLGPSSRYIRVQKDYIEQLDDVLNEPHSYMRVNWDVVSPALRFLQATPDFVVEIINVFDKFANEHDEDGETEIDGENIDNVSLLSRTELQVGMKVTIGGSDNEILTVSDISGTHFTVQNDYGEETNYSMRRFPDVYRV